MNLLNKLKGFFKKSQNKKSAPLIILQKESQESDTKEYNSIEEAISALENDPNVPKDKLQKIKSSIDNLKNKKIIKIRNGEIIDL